MNIEVELEKKLMDLRGKPASHAKAASRSHQHIKIVIYCSNAWI